MKEVGRVHTLRCFMESIFAGKALAGDLYTKMGLSFVLEKGYNLGYQDTDARQDAILKSFWADIFDDQPKVAKNIQKP